MYPTIQKLKFKYACGLTSRNRKGDNDNDELISSDDETDIDGNCDYDHGESQKKSNPPPRPNLNNIAMIFQQKIYESLFDHWNQTSDIELLATLLDPHLKKMVLFDYETRTRTIEKLKELYLELKYVKEQDRQSSCISSSSQTTKEVTKFQSPDGYSIREWKLTIYAINDVGAKFQANFIEKVEYNLHPTFKNPTRIMKKAPFTIIEKGWGEFDMNIRLFFPDKSIDPWNIDFDLNFQKPHYER
ncbi:13306_t:CDS:2 [Entrophospora sp. SA101]|nr:13306_t:CDS:2 [Entrophospora sp. SA101]